MLQRPQVLIVDRSAETREVLRTILQRDGVNIAEAESQIEGLQLVKRLHPQVLVIDTDTVDLSDTDVCHEFDDETRAENTSVVVLGRIQTSDNVLPTSEVVAKPYHYAPLIRKIETLLEQAEPLD